MCSLFHLLGSTGRRGLDVEDVVAADENLAEEASKLSIDEFLRLVETEVHVGIRRGEDALILLAPLQTDSDGLAGQIRQERLGVDDELGLWWWRAVGAGRVRGERTGGYACVGTKRK